MTTKYARSVKNNAVNREKQNVLCLKSELSFVKLNREPASKVETSAVRLVSLLCNTSNICGSVNTTKNRFKCDKAIDKRVENDNSDNSYARNADDAELVTLLKEIQIQNRESFDRFYDLTVKRCFSFSLRITSQYDIAEEVISDLYMQVWNTAQHFDTQKGGVLTWLLMMCRSRSIDALRSRKKYALETADIDEQRDAVADDDPQDLLSSVQSESVLCNALKRLDANDRQLVALAFFRGYSHTELSDMTGMPLGTVKSRIRRAVIEMKQIITGKCGDFTIGGRDV